MVHWRPRDDEGTMVDLLGRDEKTRKTYVTKTPAKGVQQAILHYRVLDNRQGFSLVEIRLETGRTHQIRAQFSARGLPLAGDRNTASILTPQTGRSPSVQPPVFTHPETGEAMDFRLPPPDTAPWTLFSE